MYKSVSYKELHVFYKKMEYMWETSIICNNYLK